MSNGKSFKGFHISRKAIHYYCSCDERCSENGKLLCVAEKGTKKRCKYCRFQKCRTLARMKDKRVLNSAPMLQKRPIVNIHRSRQTKTFLKHDFSNVQEMVSNTKKKFVQCFFNDTEVFIVLQLSNVL